MKILKSLLMAELVALATTTAWAAASQNTPNQVSENRSIEVQVFGKFMSPNADTYQTVMRKAGDLVATSKVQNFIVKGWGIEGGIFFCLDFAPHVSIEDIAAVKSDLQAVKVPADTSFSLADTTSCLP